jgi:hypothetical protein
MAKSNVEKAATEFWKLFWSLIGWGAEEIGRVAQDVGEWSSETAQKVAVKVKADPRVRRGRFWLRVILIATAWLPIQLVITAITAPQLVTFLAFGPIVIGFLVLFRWPYISSALAAAGLTTPQGRKVVIFFLVALGFELAMGVYLTMIPVGSNPSGIPVTALIVAAAVAFIGARKLAGKKGVGLIGFILIILFLSQTSAFIGVRAAEGVPESASAGTVQAANFPVCAGEPAVHHIGEGQVKPVTVSLGTNCASGTISIDLDSAVQGFAIEPGPNLGDELDVILGSGRVVRLKRGELPCVETSILEWANFHLRGVTATEATIVFDTIPFDCIG